METKFDENCCDLFLFTEPKLHHWKIMFRNFNNLQPGDQVICLILEIFSSIRIFLVEFI